jgi:5-methylcytosine-specific restriction endonuclease McrA
MLEFLHLAGQNFVIFPASSFNRDDLITCAVFIRDNFTCLGCDAKISFAKERPYINRIYPHEGEDRISNLYTACRECHEKESNRRWKELAASRLVSAIEKRNTLLDELLGFDSREKVR